MRRSILEALRARYEAEIAEADATANIYLENSVGIGEHPQHIEEVNKQIEKIANAKEKRLKIGSSNSPAEILRGTYALIKTATSVDDSLLQSNDLALL